MTIGASFGSRQEFAEYQQFIERRKDLPLWSGKRIKDRTVPFHGGYRIETPGPRASLFLFVYSYGPNGAMYVHPARADEEGCVGAFCGGEMTEKPISIEAAREIAKAPVVKRRSDLEIERPLHGRDT